MAYTFGKRKDVVFKALKALLQPFGISMFYTDDWGSYERNIDPKEHTISKEKHPSHRTQKSHAPHTD